MIDIGSDFSDTPSRNNKGDKVSSRKSSFNDQEKKAIQDLLTVVGLFRARNPKMTLQQLTALLLVAYEEGMPVTRYATKAGIAQGVMTRHLFDLGELNRNREPGMGLVEQRPDISDRRSHLTHLTHTGKALLHNVIRAFRG
jgi:DNA-binding MarR family transcriptional regulator